MNRYLTFKRNFDKKIMTEEIRASSLLQTIAYDPEDNFFLMDDKTVGIAFICNPLNFGDSKIQERVNGFLNQEFPAGTIISFLLFRSPDLVKQTNAMMSLRDGFYHPLMRDVLAERKSFILDHTANPIESRTSKGYYNLGILQDLKLVVSVKLPINASRPNKGEIEKIKDMNTMVLSSLQTIGLAPQQMNAEDYIRFINTMFNWGSESTWRTTGTDWDDGKPINEQVFDYDTDVEVSASGLRIGQQHIKVLSAKKMPDYAYFGDSLQYVGDLSGGNANILENYMICVNIHIPDTEKKNSKITRNRQFVVNQAYGPLLKFVRALGEKHDSFNTLDESISKGYKPLEVSYTMTIFAPTEERAAAASTAARNYWREQRFQLMEDKFIMLPCFINSLPLGADKDIVRDIFRYKTMTTEHATVLLPIFGEWKGTGTFHAALMSRNGQLMSLSLHDSPTNKNAVVAAESGSGKSFLVNELVLSYLSEGAQVWVIDVGRSYEKLCESLEGDFVHFESGTEVCLNPFPLIHDYSEDEDGICSLVMAMASEGGNLCEYQKAELKRILAICWDDNGKDLIIDHIADKCLESPDQRVKDVGVQLHSFTSKGSYGRYFSQKNNVSFQNQFTVLELDELQGRKHLRQVVLLQLIFQIQQEVFLGDANRKKVVIIDEAWDLLKEGEVAVFMEHAYRKFRKYGGSVLIATQSVNDLYENAVGRAIAENSSSLYLLGQTDETVESIRETKRLAIAEGGYQMLKGVRTVAGVYSEIFIKSNAGIGIGRLVVGEFQKLLYSTDPVDKAEIAKYVAQGQNTGEAIRTVIKSRAMRFTN